MHPGLVGGIIGAFFGLCGGIIGTYFSIKNTNGPRERAFMVKGALTVWISIFIFLGLLIILPHPYRWFLFLPWGVLLPFGILYMNRKQREIRNRESRKP